MSSSVRAKPFVKPMHRGQFPAVSCRHARVDGPERQSGRNAYPSGVTPSTIMSPAGRTAGSRTEIRLGARARNTRTINRAHAPPVNRSTNHVNPDRVLDTWSLHR
jgi:hypothetical protein